MSHRYQEIWDKVEPILRKTLVELSSSLGRADIDLVTDFLDHNELGVALEWMVSIVSERSVPIKETTRQGMHEAARLMNMSLEL
jgi:hypothetical protein